MARDTIGGKLKPSKVMNHLSKPQRHAIIMRNSSLFVLNKTVPAQRLRQWYNIPTLDIQDLNEVDTVKMIRNHDLCMVTAYTKLNQLLTRRGLVIRRQNGVYKLQTLPKAARRVGQLAEESRTKAYASTRLSNGITRYHGIFSSLSDDELT